MRKLSYFIAGTIDGFIAAPDGTYDFFFPYVTGDFLPYLSDTFADTIPALGRTAMGLDGVPNKRYDTVLMGRATYEPGLALGMASPYPHLRQIVFSRSLTESPDPAVEVTAEDPLPVVRRLKQEDGLDIWLCGGGTLAGQLLPEIDELIIKLNPIVAGSGVPVFSADFALRAFDLVESRSFDNGTVVLTYAKSTLATGGELGADGMPLAPAS
ncbi:dihydrofolate reductase family protein [Kitasatospora sp. NPDC047058]|uniref:dihydrofolate reductase family protein n=1 Tax=Kitasatospora sp. NPDC047058 TaxID=3155620 RepID=UPI0033D32F60